MNKILPTMFALRDSHEKIVGVMSSNVDDLLFGSLPDSEGPMDKILDKFSVRDRSEKSFRFCGKEIVQHDDFSITATVTDNTEKIRPIEIADKRKGTDKCTEAETTFLCGILGMDCSTGKARTLIPSV